MEKVVKATRVSRAHSIGEIGVANMAKIRRHSVRIIIQRQKHAVICAKMKSWST